MILIKTLHMLCANKCLLLRQGAALSHYFTSVLFQQKTSVLSQEQTSVLSRQQTSVLSQQKTCILSEQQTFGPEPAEFWPGTRGILLVKSGIRTPRWSVPKVARMTAVQQTPSNQESSRGPQKRPQRIAQQLNCGALGTGTALKILKKNKLLINGAKRPLNCKEE